jgi:hypothetical protein
LALGAWLRGKLRSKATRRTDRRFAQLLVLENDRSTLLADERDLCPQRRILAQRSFDALHVAQGEPAGHVERQKKLNFVLETIESGQFHETPETLYSHWSRAAAIRFTGRANKFREMRGVDQRKLIEGRKAGQRRYVE